LFFEVHVKNIALHNARVLKISLILLMCILCENLEKLAHQTYWRLVALSGTLRSSSSSKEKMRSHCFAFHTSLFTRTFLFVRYLSGVFEC